MRLNKKENQKNDLSADTTVLSLCTSLQSIELISKTKTDFVQSKLIYRLLMLVLIFQLFLVTSAKKIETSQEINEEKLPQLDTEGELIQADLSLVGAAASSSVFFKAQSQPLPLVFTFDAIVKELLPKVCIFNQIYSKESRKIGAISPAKAEKIVKEVFPLAINASNSLLALEFLGNQNKKIYIDFTSNPQYLQGALAKHYIHPHDQIFFSIEIPTNKETILAFLANEMQHLNVAVRQRAYHGEKKISYDELHSPYNKPEEKKHLEKSIYDGLFSLWKSTAIMPLLSKDRGADQMANIFKYDLPIIKKLITELSKPGQLQGKTKKYFDVLKKEAQEQKSYYQPFSQQVKFLELDSDIATLKALTGEPFFSDWSEYHKKFCETSLGSLLTKRALS